MKTLLLIGLAGATAMAPAAASATESAPAANDSAPNPDRYRVNYDDSILMNEDRVFASHPGASGSSTYQGDWNGAYRKDGTYQGQWQGTYRDAQGTVYEGQYTGTFIGTDPAQTGVSYAGDPPLDSAAAPVDAGTDYQVRPQYSRVPAAEYRAPAPQPQYQNHAQYQAYPQYQQHPQYQTQPQYQPQVRYPNGWNGGYYYPAYYQPPVTTIVIQSAPGTTTTTYYEE